MHQEVNATAPLNDFDLAEDWIEVRYLDTRQVPDPDFVQVPEMIPNPNFDEEDFESLPEIPNPDFPQDFSPVDEEFHVETAEFRAQTGENYGQLVARVRSGVAIRTGAIAPPDPGPDSVPAKRPDHSLSL